MDLVSGQHFLQNLSNQAESWQIVSLQCHAAHVVSGWLVGGFGLNGPLRQYFSLYRAVSQREGERGEKG